MTRSMVGVATALVLVTAAQGAIAQELKAAVLAGGCFWCVESDFDQVPGVVETVSGYTGGTTADPTYKQVSAGGTGHREAVRITYDPALVSYAELLSVFFRSVDPTDAGGQFCDRGQSYETAIFVADDDERRQAEAAKRDAETVLGREVVTPIETAGPFHPAEEYHQDYYEKNPLRYRFYRTSCGRDRRVKELWGGEAHRGIVGHK